MLKNEKWSHWAPIPEARNFYHIASIENSSISDLKIQLLNTSGKEKIEVFFEKSVKSYMNLNESFFTNVIYEIKKQYGEDFYKNSTFFKVVHSAYLEEYYERVDSNFEKQPLLHFAFIAFDDMVHVITSKEPSIRLITLT